MNQTEAFFYTHQGLERQGPGSTATTKTLFELATQDHSVADVVDLGSGPGSSSLWLAEQGLNVRAVDSHAPFLDELRRRATLGRLDKKITIVEGSIDDEVALAGPFDLAWAEGTAYIIGLNRALTIWKRLLRPGGRIVITDCFWTTDNRSSKAVAFWAADPDMMTVNQAKELFTQHDLQILGSVTQPNTDWFDEYYLPLESRVNTLEGAADPILQKAIADVREEIEVRRNFGTEYEHVGFVLTPIK